MLLTWPKKKKNNGKIFVSEDVPDTALTQVRENFFGIEWALDFKVAQ